MLGTEGSSWQRNHLELEFYLVREALDSSMKGILWKISILALLFKESDLFKMNDDGYDDEDVKTPNEDYFVAFCCKLSKNMFNKHVFKKEY